MLQQTQVSTVIPYFERFLAEFPDVRNLAEAPLERVLELWSGLGYYSRARNLHRCARQLVDSHDGVFPVDAAKLESLPGIGRSTAAAIRSLAFDLPAAILDGNVKRVMARHFGVPGYPGESSVQKQLWAIAERELPVQDAAAYTQGLMDLGAGPCARRRPACKDCPVVASCLAHRDGSTADIPASRPKAKLRERHVILLAALRGHEVLLERRPPTGIWGGLWSLPEIEIGADEFEGAEVASESLATIERWLSGQGLAAIGQQWLPAFTHLFTHQRLGVLPVLIQTKALPAAASRASEAAYVWLPLDECAEAALPRPVKTLLVGARR